MNPIEAFEKWFLSIPPAHQDEISLLASMFLPGISTPLVSDTSVKIKFMDYVLAHKQNPFKAIGMAIALQGIIDHAVGQLSNTRASAVEVQDLLTRVKEKVESKNEEGSAAILDKLIQEMPFKVAQWNVTASSWVALKEEHFTDAALRDTLQEG